MIVDSFSLEKIGSACNAWAAIEEFTKKKASQKKVKPSFHWGSAHCGWAAMLTPNNKIVDTSIP